MKKQYGTVNVGTKEYAESAAASRGGSPEVKRPLVKIEDGPDHQGYNAKMIAGEFTLPDTKECQDASLEVAFRILGILVTKDLLGHMPGIITGENVGQLVPYYPFSYHKRFGATYTDRMCPASTRKGKCPVCEGRMELFQSPQYKNGTLSKDDIMGAGFGTKQTALVIARIYFNGEDLGIRTFLTNLTNEKSANAKHDNFFDLIAQLATPKKLMAGDVLPPDYYSNGDGARWIVAEYVRAMYQPTDKGGDQTGKRAAMPYWKLSNLAATKELPGVGKASDIWWPEFGKGKDAKDGCELVDVYDLINHTPDEELASCVAEKMRMLLSPKKHRDAAPNGETGQSGASVPEKERELLDTPTWEVILDMSAEELVRYGVSKGGNAHDLELTGATNLGALRRCVAKLWAITPKPATQTAPAGTVAMTPQQDEQDNESLPF